MTWLCTDAAKNINGQDFVISAEHVSLMSQPRPVSTLWTEGDWSLDRFDELLPQGVTRGLRNAFGPKDPPRTIGADILE